MIFPLETMKEKTKKFYQDLGCDLDEKDEKDLNLAVQSLTMPCYANEFNQSHEVQLYNNFSLATVGDAYWGAFIVARKFTPDSTKGELSNEIKQKIGSNQEMNRLAEKLLKDHLFAENNDLTINDSDAPNTKGYATALEAVVGFLFLVYPEKVSSILEDRFADALDHFASTQLEQED